MSSRVQDFKRQRTERLQPLIDLPPPTSSRELKRVCGMFAYYSRWIQDFSRKARPLLQSTEFPLPQSALDAFAELKQELLQASLGSIREDVTFEVECDASDYAVAAILSQGGRPVAYMSRTLSKCEQNYPAVEKEATAVIEVVRRWFHFPKTRSFTIVTDQRSLSFMYDQKKRRKITKHQNTDVAT